MEVFMAEPIRRGFRAFVEKHDALFTTVGALIVFLGFFVKEGVKEKIKDLSASITSASEFYKVNDSLNLVSQQNLHTQGLVMSAYREVRKQTGHVRFSADDQVEAQLDLTSEVENLEARFSIAEELFNSLETRPPWLEREHSELAKLFVPEEELTEATSIAFSQLFDEKTTSDPDKDAHRLSDLLGKMTSMHTYYDTYLPHFADHVRQASVQQRKEREKELNFATYATYGLFTLGWGLGLIGKVLKLPALGGGGGGGGD
jgi:hypothetical protein